MNLKPQDQLKRTIRHILKLKQLFNQDPLLSTRNFIQASLTARFHMITTIAAKNELKRLLR